MFAKTPKSLFVVVLGAIVALRAAIAWILPITLDESYYLEWSKALDWGYFDHPPLVAWLGASSLLQLSNAFIGRLGALLVAALSLPVFAALCRRAGVGKGRAFTAAILLFSFNVFAIAGGVLITPDVTLLLAWTIALHEGVVALEDDPRRWITAGLATGIGLLGKYMMVLIGPAFLLALLWRKRSALLTVWPYLGAVVALVGFAPHLLWNANNDWAPIRFQLAHGFAEPSELGTFSQSPIPEPLPIELDGPEARIASYFGPPPHGPAAKEDEDDEGAAFKFFRRTSAYIGACLAVWMFQLVPLAGALLARLRGRRTESPTLRPAARALLVGATWSPLLFFFFAATRKHIEANWAAVYVVGASVLLAASCAGRLRSLAVTSGVNALLFLLLALHGRSPFLPSGPDRIQKETRGFTELAERVDGLQPLLFRRHQTGAMLHFYRPNMTFAQWPGATRPSEFIRRAEWNPYTTADLSANGGFWFIGRKYVPSRMPGFEPVSSTQLRFCTEQGLIETRAFAQEPYVNPCPDTGLQTWYLVEYRPLD